MISSRPRKHAQAQGIAGESSRRRAARQGGVHMRAGPRCVVPSGTAYAIAALLVLLIIVLGSSTHAVASPRADEAAAPPGWSLLRLPAEENYSYRLAVHPRAARTLLLAKHGELYRSNDSGETWTGVLGATVLDVAYAPSLPTRIYAVGKSPTTYETVFMRSDDDGASWTEFPLPAGLCYLTVAPSAPDRIYARQCTESLSANGFGFYLSSNAGETWKQGVLPDGLPLRALAVSPTNPQVLMISNAGAVYRSLDGGATWQRVLELASVRSIVMNPYAANQVFVSSYKGIARSQDGGATWEAPARSAYFWDAVAWPNRNGLAALQWDPAANDYVGAFWELGPKSWTRRTWTIPAKPSLLYRSQNDPTLLYLEDQRGQFWRYTPPAINVHLPIIAGAPAAPARTDAEIALARVNALRAPMGLLPMALDARISQAATNAARYDSLNHFDPSAWDGNPHYEVRGKPGFTGRTPGDRCLATGYPYGCGEVKHYLGDPVASVDGWMATVYHRLSLISPYYSVGGYGLSHLNNFDVDVLNMSSGEAGGWISALPFLWVYPFDGQTNVPTQWSGGEWPNPLPPGAHGPVGYTITVQGMNGAWKITSGELRDKNDALTPVYPNPPDCTAWYCYAIIPVAPLRPWTTYTVTVRGTLADAAFEKKWHFTTGAMTDVTAAEAGGLVIGPPAEEPRIASPSAAPEPIAP